MIAQPVMVKKYQIIYADPPWECSNQNVSQKSYVFTDRVGSHYQVMPLKDICSTKSGKKRKWFTDII